MGNDESQLRTELAELVGERPDWRLEPLSTPGAAPLWCYGRQGQSEFSVTAEGAGIRLFTTGSDEEIMFDDAETLRVWLAEQRPDALQDPPVKLRGRARWRRFFEWS